MLIDGLAVAAVYFGFIVGCFGIAAVVRLFFPAWFDGVSDDE